MELTPYLEYVEQRLSSLRRRHVLRVMAVMEDLASIYELDRDQAILAGLLHDSAKEMSTERQMALVQAAGIELSHPCEEHPLYLHGPASACLVSQDLSITDPAVLEAIASHSNHAPAAQPRLAWCLRLADLLAPVRPWNGIDKLRRVTYAGEWQDAALLLTNWLIEYLQELDIPVHPNLPANLTRLANGQDLSPTFFSRN
jgi:predicted HD superfamily hydrolase involved in NAD metabolism